MMFFPLCLSPHAPSLPHVFLDPGLKLCYTPAVADNEKGIH